MNMHTRASRSGLARMAICLFTVGVTFAGCDAGDGVDDLVLGEVRIRDENGTELPGYTLSAPDVIANRNENQDALVSEALIREVYVLTTDPGDGGVSACTEFGDVDQEEGLVPYPAVVIDLQSRSTQSIALIARWLAGDPGGDTALLATASYPFTVGGVGDDNRLELVAGDGTAPGGAESTFVEGRADRAGDCAENLPPSSNASFALDVDADGLGSLGELNSGLGLASGALLLDVPVEGGLDTGDGIGGVVVALAEISLDMPLPVTWGLVERYSIANSDSESGLPSLDARVATSEGNLYVDVLVPGESVQEGDSLDVAAAVTDGEELTCPPTYRRGEEAPDLSDGLESGVFSLMTQPELFLVRCSGETAVNRIELGVTVTLSPEPSVVAAGEAASPSDPMVWTRSDVLIVYAPEPPGR